MDFLLPAMSPLRIFGHTRLTHGHLISRDDSPVCGRCQVRLLVFHVLVECPAYYVPRNQVFPYLPSMPLRERLYLLSESPTFSSSTLFAFLRMSGLMFDL